MNNKYSNFKATMAIATASFRSIVRSPSSVVFTLLFPLIFILVFGFIGGNTVSVDVGVAKNSDIKNPLFDSLKKISVINLIQNQSAADMQSNLSKGHIDAILDIEKHNTAPYMTVDVTYTQASQEKGSILQSVLMRMFYKINQATRPAFAPPPVDSWAFPCSVPAFSVRRSCSLA
jgi:ABC-2 type transport system permease protein